MQLHSFLIPMITGILVGLFTRIMLVQTSYRQFPSKPHGMIIHIFLGFVASLLGALVIPAIFKPDFTAGVFISIGTAQFHTIRGLEREAWRNLDKGEIVPRGAAYIEGLAVSFESRIFIVVGISATTTLVSYFFKWPIGLVYGVVIAFLLRRWKKGKTVSDMADVRVGHVTLDNQVLSVNGLKVSELQSSSTVVPSDFVGVVVEPRDFSAVLTLAHEGQQQAILHNLAIALGVQNHTDFQPTVTYYPKEQKLVLVLLPLLLDSGVAVQAISGAPILEAVIRRPIALSS